MESRCPICGAPIAHETLKGLQALALRHCKKKPVKQERPPVRQVYPVLPWSLRLPLALKSENAFAWAHWSTYAKEKTSIERLVDPLLLGLKGCQWLRSEWRVTRVYCKPAREFDDANLRGGTAKILLDRLVKCHVIWDDAPKFFHADYEQVEGPVNETILTLLAYTPHT